MPRPSGYSRMQIRLHWIIVALVALQYLLKDTISEAWSASLDGNEVTFEPLIAQHVLLGGLVAVLTLWRLGLRLTRGTPAPAGTDGGPKAAIARATHGAFYALLLLLPVSGSVAWFGAVTQAATAHNILKTLLLALMALHVIGALLQQFIGKTDVMSRMKRPAN